MFVCVFISDFPVEAIVRAEPDLREHAIAIIEGDPPLATVIAVNDQSRAIGVELGLTQVEAEGRMQVACAAKQWRIRYRSVSQEQATSAALLDCICAFSPRVEATAPDTVIADIAGLEQLFGTTSKIARDIGRHCAEAGLEVHIAAAANPDAALHAARGFSGITLIAEGEEAERLGPLPLETLITPRYGKSVAKNERQTREREREMLDTFERWGIRTLRALALLAEVAIVERLGQAGLQWQRFARGSTKRELVLAEPPLQFEEAIELEHAVDLLDPLIFLLSRMLEQLCSRLQSRALATHELRLRLQLDPEISVDREGLPIEGEPFDEGRDSQRTLSSGGSWKDSSRELIERIIKLPVPMLDAKTFLRLLQLDLKANPPSSPVLKLWLRAEPVRPKFDQHGLFLPLTPEPQKLEITLARLSGITGKENLGSVEVLDTYRPDAFRMTRFAPTSPTYEQANGPDKQAKTFSALRRFRPPKPISVMLIHDRPWTIGPPRALVQPDEITSTSYGEVSWCAGPWRTSGEWWNHESWEREEWDIAIPGQVNSNHQLVYRIFRDVQSDTWFVEGEYD